MKLGNLALCIIPLLSTFVSADEPVRTSMVSIPNDVVRPCEEKWETRRVPNALVGSFQRKKDEEPLVTIGETGVTGGSAALLAAAMSPYRDFKTSPFCVKQSFKDGKKSFSITLSFEDHITGEDPITWNKSYSYSRKIEHFYEGKKAGKTEITFNDSRNQKPGWSFSVGGLTGGSDNGKSGTAMYRFGGNGPKNYPMEKVSDAPRAADPSRN